MAYKYKSFLVGFCPIFIYITIKSYLDFLKWNYILHVIYKFNSIGLEKVWNFILQSNNFTRIVWVPRKDG